MLACLFPSEGEPDRVLVLAGDWQVFGLADFFGQFGRFSYLPPLPSLTDQCC
jgi:hypothetical protein